jgi:hypothetical protein
LPTEKGWAYLRGRLDLPPDASELCVVEELRRLKDAADAPVPAESLLVAAARGKVAASAGRVTFVQALSEVTAENPELARRFRAEQHGPRLATRVDLATDIEKTAALATRQKAIREGASS